MNAIITDSIKKHESIANAKYSHKITDNILEAQLLFEDDHIVYITVNACSMIYVSRMNSTELFNYIMADKYPADAARDELVDAGGFESYDMRDHRSYYRDSAYAEHIADSILLLLDNALSKQPSAAAESRD